MLDQSANILRRSSLTQTASQEAKKQGEIIMAKFFISYTVTVCRRVGLSRRSFFSLIIPANDINGVTSEEDIEKLRRHAVNHAIENVSWVHIPPECRNIDSLDLLSFYSLDGKVS